MLNADFLLLKRNNNLWNSKVWKYQKNSSTHYPPKMAVFAEKSQKNYVFPTLGQKNTNLVIINTKKLAVCDF